jgi:hypothetical protein
MSDEAGGRGASAPRSLDELWALRTDYRDVEVEDLGGQALRLYALTGTARAQLMSEMAGLADIADDPDAMKDPAVVRRVFAYQGHAVAASLGYPLSDWDGLADVLGAQTIETLYATVAELSGLEKAQQEKAVRRLRPARSAASGTD